MRKKLSGLLSLGVAGLTLSLPQGAHALPLDFGAIQGSLDTTVSAGVSVRTEDPDDGNIGIGNGGTARTVNEDDGNLNYESGDIISSTLKATHDLELKYRNYGLFNRISYFYDFQAKSDEEFFGSRGRDRLVSELDFLDIFAYANFKVADRNASVRLGKQVVNWGESTFLQNSINSINPVDVAKLRTPGAELKEALLPIPMFWGSVSLTPTVSMEGVWIWNYQETVIDPRGSFFSTNDFLSDDGDRAFVGGGRRNDQHNAQPVSPTTAAVAIPRVGDDRPNGETQQYGVALRYFADWLNSTEFALYYLKYHSRLPLISGTRAADTSSTPARAASSNYFAEYPGNIELYGLSFNTDGPFGIALQGEYSYRPNLPVQLAGVEILLAALRLPNVIDSAEGTNGATAPARTEGFRRIRAHQVLTTGTKAFGPTLGANQFVLLGEAGLTRLELDKDLLYAGPGTTTLPSCLNPAPIIAATGNGSCQDRTGFADRTSYGYRAVARMDFENAIGAAQLSPRLVFAHDINGVGPIFNEDTKAITVGLGFNYLQRWQADIGYTAFFDGRVDSGTDPIPPGTIIPPTPPATAPTVFGGSSAQSASYSTNLNPNEDRDFFAISVSYAF